MAERRPAEAARELLTAALDAVTAARVLEAREGRGPGQLAVGPRGSVAVFLPATSGAVRRVAEFDRGGALVAVLRWGAAGLRRAWVRVGEALWLDLEPRAGTVSPWGPVDRIGRAPAPGARGTPLTVAEALDWERIDRIPVVADPGALPRTAGSALLGLIAALAADQGTPTVGYRGPYPSEQLFVALLEAFHYESDAEDPLAAFMAGGVRWRPAPPERWFAPRGIYVQLRDRVEKVRWQGRTYVRPDWQGVVRHAPYRIRDAEDGVRCGLWALGGPLEDHLLLTPDGTLVAQLAPTGDAGPLVTAPQALPDAVARGVGAVVARSSAPSLGPGIRACAGELRLEWGPVRRDLIAIRGDRVRLSLAWGHRLAALLRQRRDRTSRAAAALMALAELGQLLGDTLRWRAQAALAAGPETVQRRLLEQPPPPDPDDARVIVAAAEALVAALAR